MSAAPIRPVFILSTGRCGTLALQRFIQQSDRLEAFHRYRGRAADYRNPMSLLLEQNYTYYRVLREEGGESPEIRATMVDRLRAARGGLIERLAREGKGFLELNHEFTPFAPLMPQAYPDARFIHLVRHPRRVVSSFMRKFDPPPMARPAFFGTRYSLKGQYVLRFGHVERLHRLLPEWLRRRVPLPRFDKHLHPFRRVNGRWVENQSMTAFEKTVWYWNAINRLVHDFLASRPDEEGFRLRSETLFSGDEDQLEPLFAWLNLPGLSPRELTGFLERERFNPRRPRGDFPAAENWDPRAMRILADLAGPTAERLGYDLETL